MPAPLTKPPDPPVVDTQVLSINLDVVRRTLHVLAATVWVGVRSSCWCSWVPCAGIAPAAAIAPATRAYPWVAWPAFAVLVATGVWLIAAAGEQCNAYQVTLMVKMVFVVLSGVGAALHTFVKNPTLRGVWASVGLISGLCAVLLGVSIVEAP